MNEKTAADPLPTVLQSDMNVTMKASVQPALGCFLVALTWAAPAAADTAYTQCIDSTSTLLEWGDCGEAWLDRLDNALNVAWKRAKSSVDEQGQKALLEEQRAWLKFRESSCTFWAEGSYGRNGQILHFIGCRAAINEARISDLNRIYEFAREHQ